MEGTMTEEEKMQEIVAETENDSLLPEDRQSYEDRDNSESFDNPTEKHAEDTDDQAAEDVLPTEDTDEVIEDAHPAEDVIDEVTEDNPPVEDNTNRTTEDNLPVETADDSDDDFEEDEPQPEENIQVTIESVIEAILFASDEPIRPARIADMVETGIKQVREHIKALNAKYRASNNAFRIERIAGGYQMLTLSVYNEWLKKLLRIRSDNKLSVAAIETLAIISYKQPIIRADVESIRGVAAGEMIRQLMRKGLVKIVGRAEILGRPMMYGTTKKFLEVFGLNSLKDLPKVEELKKPQ